MGVVSRKRVWVESMGVASGCVCTPFVLSLLFLAASFLLCSFFKKFFILV